MTTTIISVSKAQQSYNIAWDSLPPASRDFIINYGLRQYLNDSVAGVKPDQTIEAQKAVNARMEALRLGTVGVRATVERNPIKAEAKREVLKALRLKKIKPENVENLEEIISRHAEKHAGRLEKIVALRNASAEVELTIED